VGKVREHHQILSGWPVGGRCGLRLGTSVWRAAQSENADDAKPASVHAEGMQGQKNRGVGPELRGDWRAKLKRRAAVSF
jgi:hypothetical protein